jgi:hypothetical protein
MNNKNMHSKTDIKNEKKVAHPCQYCSKPCFGLQCKDCHLKMLDERNANCIDCETSFYALRKDGSKRKRCFDCQKIYAETYYKNCSGCNESFRFMLDNGKVFEKCSRCYASRKEEREEKEQNTKDLQNCATKRCPNKTSHTFCSHCFKNQKSLEDQYMISTCVVCRYRSPGNFKYCSSNCKNM